MGLGEIDNNLGGKFISGFGGFSSPQQYGPSERAGESGEKYFRKEEKKQEREKKKQEREERKKERQERREERKQERQEKRENREKRDTERKEKKTRVESPIIIEELPEKIHHLYLDGNNMMFVASCLRNMTLGRQQRRVEQLFTRLSLQFLASTEKAIENATLVFDNTPAKKEITIEQNTPKEREQHPEQQEKDENKKTEKEEGEERRKTNFTLCSARPKYVTSDDAIVDWMHTVKSVSGVKLCVTSDRGLMERIEQEGGFVMKPKKWLLLVASLLAGRQITNLDDWMNDWCNLQVDL